MLRLDALHRAARLMVAAVLTAGALVPAGGHPAGPARSAATAAAAATGTGAARTPLDAVPYVLLDARTLSVLVPVSAGCTPVGAATAAVEEAATRVTVVASVHRPLTATGSAGRCPAVLRTQPVTVVLRAPLGDRTVVDGVGHRVVPPGAWPGLAG